MPSYPSTSPVRQIFRRYGEAWAREAVRSLARARRAGGEARVPGVLLVDPFAGTDYPDRGERVGCVGAAATLLRASERAIVALLEEDPAKVEWLRKRLAAAFPDAPVAAGPEPATGLNLWEASPAALAGLAGARDRDGATLLLLDPASASQLPLAALRGWMVDPGTDLLLRLPVADLRRLASHGGGPIADLPPRLRRTVEGLSSFLGDARHAWVHQWARGRREDVGAAAAGFVEAYAERARAAGIPVVRRLEVGTDAGVEHLLLCTHRPAGALLLNRVLHELRAEGALPSPRHEGGPVRYRRRTELALFSDDSTAAEDGRERSVDLHRLAHALGERFAGQSVTWDELVRSHAESDLLAEDLRRALLALRRDGRALFRSLAPDSAIAFPRTGTRWVRGSTAPARRRGGAEELELGI